MKQKIISYLSTIKNELSDISKYIYENPEESFHEYKSYNYLTKILKKHNFHVTEKYIDIPTAFSAQFGKGHPKLCFICEYDAVHDLGHIYGYNASSAICTGAALGLSEVIPLTGGSVIVIGCPGEIAGSSKITMANQGVFEDIDALLSSQPNTLSAVSTNASVAEEEFYVNGLPYTELISNNILNRLFAHNLKEMGIIDIIETENIPANLGIRNISRVIPCLHSYINITENPNIKYGTKAFASETISSFAEAQIIKASGALAITGLDLIEKPSLISEIEAEFYNKIKTLQKI